MKLWYKFQAWRWYRKSEQYIEMDWVEDSLAAAEKAMAYAKKAV